MAFRSSSSPLLALALLGASPLHAQRIGPEPSQAHVEEPIGATGLNHATRHLAVILRLAQDEAAHYAGVLRTARAAGLPEPPQLEACVAAFQGMQEALPVLHRALRSRSAAAVREAEATLTDAYRELERTVNDLSREVGALLAARVANPEG
jgi:hypothetical protein